MKTFHVEDANIYYMQQIDNLVLNSKIFFYEHDVRVGKRPDQPTWTYDLVYLRFNPTQFI